MIPLRSLKFLSAILAGQRSSVKVSLKSAFPLIRRVKGMEEIINNARAFRTPLLDAH